MEEVLVSYIERLENTYGVIMSHALFTKAKQMFLHEFRNEEKINALVLGYHFNEYIEDDNYYLPTDKKINNEVTTELNNINKSSIAIIKIPFIRSAGPNKNFHVDLEISRDFLFDIVNVLRKNTRSKYLPVLTLGKINFEVATTVGIMLGMPYLNIFSVCHPFLIDELNNTYQNSVSDYERTIITKLLTYFIYNVKFVVSTFINAIESASSTLPTQKEFTSPSQ